MELQPQSDNVQPMEINCFPGHMPLFNKWLVNTTTQSAKYFLLTLPLQRHPRHWPKVTSPRWWCIIPYATIQWMACWWSIYLMLAISSHIFPLYWIMFSSRSTLPHINIHNAQHLFLHFNICNVWHTCVHHSDPPSHLSTIMPITLKDNNLPPVHWWQCNTNGNAMQLHYLIVPIMLLGAMLAVLVQHTWVSVILLSFPPLSMSYCHF